MHSALPRRYLAPVTVVLLLAGVALAGPYQSLGKWQEENDREALKGRFDQVARNFAEFDSAFYSYTLEFEVVPADTQAMIDSGHLRATLINPYTGDPVRFVTSAEPHQPIEDDSGSAGDIWYLASPETGDFGMAAYYLYPNDPQRTKWMRRDMIAYVNPAERSVLFDDGSRADQLMRVNMEHLVAALADFVIRFGEVPAELAELDSGDTLTSFQNPYDTGRLCGVSETHSPGDICYVKIGDETYDLIGWGEQGPVYYYSEAEDRWGVTCREDGTWELITERPEAPENMLPVIPGVLWNKTRALAYAQVRIDVARKADWEATHPECVDCGTTYVFWDYSQGEVKCRDARTGEFLEECCCGELESGVVITE